MCAKVVGLYYLQTLGCPKNQVDSDKLGGYLHAHGYDGVTDPADADRDVVVVHTTSARSDRRFDFGHGRPVPERPQITGALAGSRG